MEYVKINSSQNVSIEFRLANVFERIAAFFIDIIIICLYIYTLLFFLRIISWNSNSINFIDNLSGSVNLSDLVEILFILIVFLPVVFYSFLFEFFMNGQTLGKAIMKIKVIKIDGFQMSFLDYFVRWLFRLIDIYSSYGFVAFISILISKKSQRIGEIASGSATVSLKRDAKINDTIFTELDINYKPVFSQVIILSDNDMRIIKENFTIALKNKDKALFNKLSDKITTVLKIKNPYENDTEFITTIINDYNYYTQYN